MVIVLSPACEQPAGVRGSEMCPSVRFNGTDDEGSSGRDSSGNHNITGNASVKYKSFSRGEGMIGQSGSDSEKGENSIHSP